MATAVEQRSLPHLGAMAYDNMRYSTSPQFTNPWATANGPGAQHPLYNQSMHQPNGVADPQQAPRTLYPQTSHTGPGPLGPDSMHQARQYPTDYASGPPSNPAAYAPTAGLRYSPEHHYSNVGSYGHYDTAQRRQSYQAPMSGRDSFNEALDASRGMVAMSQDYTPRNVYNPRNGAQDSYGFPTTSSPHSSISSASSYPYYGSYNGSVDGSVAGSSITDYSSTSEEAMQRTLPAPGQMIGGFPPEPSTMMTQFNSKLAASAQKKHKCKICDKRFTRPSSLQTHMYSHTGEKPFACDYEGCGRHFSVVSNLRRHKKCHRGGSGHPSPEEEE